MYWLGPKKKKRKQLEAESVEDTVVYLTENSENSMISRGVEVDENKIYFYCNVNEAEALEFNKLIKKLDHEMQYLAIRLGIDPPPIELHIHSDGGNPFAGLAIHDAIKACKTPVHTFIDGSIASAATLIFAAGAKRKVYKNSFMLIHQLSGIVSGKHEDFKDELKNQEQLMDTFVEIYLNASTLTREEIVDLMKREVWLSSKKILEIGFADEIL
jgi:ATP-dependent protease ClpP protease subunit